MILFRLAVDNQSSATLVRIPIKDCDQKSWITQDCGTVGIAIASNTSGPGFRSSDGNYCQEFCKLLKRRNQKEKKRP